MAETKKTVFTQASEKSNQVQQIPVKADMIVPDSKPDIGRILKTKVRLDIGEKSLDNGRLHWSGQLICQILYAGEEDVRELHCMEHTLNVDEFMNLEIPEGEGRIRYTLGGAVEDVKATILNSRKLNLQVVLNLKADVIRYAEHTVISQVEGIPQLQVRKSEKKITVLCMDREEKYMVKEEIPIASTAPNIREILWWETSIAGVEPRILDGRASVKGELLVNILYRGENSEEPAEYIEGRIPFQGLMDAPDIYAGAPVKVGVCPSGITVRTAADEDGEPRVVTVEAMIDCHMQVYEQQNMTMIEDIYAPGWRINPRWSLCEAQAFLQQDTAVHKINETLKIPDNYPGALQLFGVSAEPQIDEAYATEGILNVEGVIKVQLFYLSSEDRYPIAALQEVVPFSMSMASPQSEDAAVDIRPVLLNAGSELMNPREVRISADVRMDLLVMGSDVISLMTDLEAERKDPAELESMPAMVIYVVQPGEDLWQIARDYDTTPDRIAAINHLEDKRELPPGRQLLLMKNH